MGDVMPMNTYSQPPVLFVSGVTAVGKTSFVLSLIKELTSAGCFFGFDIISADSRQVYAGLEVTTGADIPHNFQQVFPDGKEKMDSSYYADQKKKIRIYGISICDCSQSWSVSQFRKYAQTIIQNSLHEKRLPIIVGGTGLYHKHALSNDPVLSIKPNLQVRKKVNNLSTYDLQKWLIEVNKMKFSQMNQSDRNNPVRLIRAIEISLADTVSKDIDESDWHNKVMFFCNQIKVGLTRPEKETRSRVRERIINRMDNGAFDEVSALMNRWFAVSQQVRSILGVVEMKSLLQEQIPESVCIDRWATKEFQYVKRQQTWWKKQSQITWYPYSTDQQQRQALICVKDMLAKN